MVYVSFTTALWLMAATIESSLLNPWQSPVYGLVLTLKWGMTLVALLWASTSLFQVYLNCVEHTATQKRHAGHTQDPVTCAPRIPEPDLKLIPVGVKSPVDGHSLSVVSPPVKMSPNTLSSPLTKAHSENAANATTRALEELLES